MQYDDSDETGFRYYWSGTECSTDASSCIFDAGLGRKGAALQSNVLFAVAVRPGDVAASVPEPQSLALALLAVGATAVARRRRSR